MPTIDEVAEQLAAWFEFYGPELMRRKLEKDNAAALEKQALHPTHAGDPELHSSFPFE